MSDALEAIAQAVCEVVCRIDLPLGSRPEVRPLVLRDSIRREIPHLRVSVGDILLHTQESSLRLVLAITHITELLKVGLHILFCMRAAISRRGASFTTTLQFDLSFVAMAYICLFQLDQLFSQIVEFLEVVARVGDRVRGKPWTDDQHLPR